MPEQRRDQHGRGRRFRDALHLPLLWCGLWRGDHLCGRPDYRGTRRPRPSRQLRASVHQGLDLAPYRCGPGNTAYPFAAAHAAPATRRTAAAGRLGHGAGLCNPGVCPDHPATRAGCSRLLYLGPVAYRGLLCFQQTRQGFDRHQQRGHQLAPLHEQRRGGLQADPGRGRTAGLLRRREPRPVPIYRRRQPGLCPPGAVPAH